MPYTVTDLQAAEIESLTRDDDVKVEVVEERDSMGFPCVSVTADSRERLLDYVRENWGDDEATGDWYSEFIVDQIDAVEQAKREILEDVTNGVVPATVASFSELHDHVDANEYGGLCDPDEYGEKDTAFANAVQDVVHAWIVAGGVRGGAEVDDPYQWINCECGAGPFTDSVAVAAHALQWHPDSAS